MKVYCGCSGYNYDDWKGKFYPEDLSQDEWLSYYAKQFNTVEINGTFYSLPEKATMKAWREQTPDDFQFWLKGSQYITHMKKLKLDDDLEDAIDQFYKAISPLSDKTAGILWQLPGNLKADTDKLKGFLKLLDNDYQQVVEFREPSWFTDEVYEILNDHNAACCSISSPDEELPEKIITTCDTVYLRMHGKKDWYDHDYSENELKDWLDKIEQAEASSAFVFFNNTKDQNAPDNSKRFKKLIS